MNVAQYLFQSPSPNPVQVGRLDPNSKVEDTTTTMDVPKQNIVKENPLKEVSASSNNTQNTVVPTVSQNYLLDVYA